MASAKRSWPSFFELQLYEKLKYKASGIRVLNALSFVRQPNCKFNSDASSQHHASEIQSGRRLTLALGPS
jgi:hypothetical protein